MKALGQESNILNIEQIRKFKDRNLKVLAATSNF